MPSGKRYKVRLSALVTLALLLLSVITVGVSAYEPCQQAVKKVITKVEWPHYSKATVRRWVEWGKAHPNYKAPARKPKVTQVEVEGMMAFACGMPDVESSVNDSYLLQEEPYDQLGFAMDDARPYIAELTTGNTPVALLDVPVQPQALSAGDAPEPGSWVLALTGVLLVAYAARKREALRARFAFAAPAL